MANSVCNLKMIIDLFKDKIMLKNLSDSEIESLPVDVLKEIIKDKVTARELLDLWHRLPSVCKADYYIRILLPCYLHYNMPGKTHYDGPPSSQKYCPFCEKF